MTRRHSPFGLTWSPRVSGDYHGRDVRSVDDPPLLPQALRVLNLAARRLGMYSVMVVIATVIGYLGSVVLLDPRAPMLRATPRPSDAAITARLTAVGLDPRLGPVERLVRWGTGVLHGDWGRSPDGTPVGPQVLDRALVSARLAVLALAVSVVVGIGLGVVSALNQYSWTDRGLTAAAYALQVVPTPVIYLVVQNLGISLNRAAGGTYVYVSGTTTPGAPTSGLGHLTDLAQHLVLPTIGLVLTGVAGYQILQRSVLLDAMNADYVRTARAKGLTRSQAVRRHALRTSFVPVAQMIAFAVPGIFAGSIVAEGVFAWDGLGTYALRAISDTQDVNATAAALAVSSLTFAAGALVADLAVAAVDPRARREGSR